MEVNYRTVEKICQRIDEAASAVLPAWQWTTGSFIKCNKLL